MIDLYRVYVLQDNAGCFYIGLSDDVERRVTQHNKGQSHWTKGKGPWGLVWQSELLSLSDARKLENQLKRQGRGTGFYHLTGLPKRGS
jgi:putative endonuclease